MGSQMSLVQETVNIIKPGKILVCLASGTVSFILYKQFISPRFQLQHIPGTKFRPIYGDLSDLTMGKTYEPNLETIERYHNKYGTLCRFYEMFGSIILLVSDVDVMKQILVTNCKNYQKPDNPFQIVFKELIGNGLVTLEGAEHAVHKRLMASSFNNASIRKMIPIFEEVGKRLVGIWQDQLADSGVHGKVRLEIQNDLSKATLNIIGRTAFGYNFNSLDGGHDEIAKTFEDIIGGDKLLTWRMTLPYYFYLPFPDVLRLKKAINTIRSAVINIIGKKRRHLEANKSNSKPSDILDIMMLARDESTGEGMSDLELRNEVTTLMAAGHETTSTAMAWFLLVMAEHPDIQEKCQEEVKKFLPTPDTPITMEVLEKLHYVGLVIKETLRRYPPVPLSIRQAQQDDTFLGKYHIPAKTVLYLSMRTIMLSPNNFEDPLIFNPERFDGSEDTESQNFYKFLPFLVGPRMCIGYKFALLQIKTMVACFLRELNFHKIPNTDFRPSYANRITMRPFPPLVLHASTLIQ